MNFRPRSEPSFALQAAILGAHIAVLAALDWLLVAREWVGTPIWRHVISHAGSIATIDGLILILCGALAWAGNRHRWLRRAARALAALAFALVTLAQVALSYGDHYTMTMMGRLADIRLAGVATIEGLQLLAASYGALSVAAAIGAALVVLIAVIALFVWLQALLFPPVPDGYWQLRSLSPAGRAALLAFLGSCGGAFALALHNYAAERYQDSFVALALTEPLINTSGSAAEQVQEREQYNLHAPMVARPRNIIIIVADSLRADHLPNYGYPRMTAPFLAKLQAGGHLHWVERVTSACSESTCGAYAILADKLISHASDGGNFTLNGLLKDRGYDTDFILSGSHSQYLPLLPLYGDLSDYTHYTDGDISGRGADDRAVPDYLKAMPAPSGRPNFFFIWLMSPHAFGVKFQAPFQPTPSMGPGSWFRDMGRHSFAPAVRQEIVNRYDNGVFQADGIIAQIFSILQDKGYLANSVVFITGDHGDALGERGLYGHIPYLYGEYTRIPLLIYDPLDTVYSNLSFANQTDIGATVLDLLGLPTPKSWEGLSLLSGPPRTVTYTQNDNLAMPPCRGVNLNRPGFSPYLIQCERADGTRSEEIFDMNADPLGLKPVASPLPAALLAQMRAGLDKQFPQRKNQF